MDEQQDPLQPLRHALRHPKVLAADGWYTHEDDRFAATDREFIAACQPSVIAGLLAERDELSRRLDHIIHDHHAVRAEAQSRVERARDAALEERNRLGVELAGARTRIAMSQEQAMHAMAEADDLRAEVERLRCRHWPETPADVRALLGSACAAVRYALPVPDGEFESEPHEDDTYTASAHDIITAIHRVTEHRMLCEVLTQEAEAARDAARTEAESLRAEVDRLRAEDHAAKLETDLVRMRSAVETREERDELRVQLNIIESERAELADGMSALRARLAEIERAEPVAWMRADYSGTASPTLQVEPPGEPSVDSAAAPEATR